MLIFTTLIIRNLKKFANLKIEKPQQNDRIEAVSNYILRGLNRFYGPNLALGF